MEFSTHFSRYPLPANSTYVSRSICEPPTRATSDTEGPTTLTSCPRTGTSRLVSPLYLLTHYTERVPVPEPNENKSGLWLLLKLHTEMATRLHPVHNTRQDPWNILFSKTKCKQEISNENVEQILNFLEQIRKFLNQYVYDTENTRTLTCTSLRDQQTSMFTQLAVKKNCANDCSMSSELPPSRRTSNKDETLARMGSCGSTTRETTVFKSSQKRSSRSRHKSGVRMILAR